MERAVAALFMAGWLVATTALAEEPDGTVAPASAPPPRDARLLDEIPSSAAVLGHQWSAGVPQDAREAEASVDHYGLLVEGGPAQLLTLQDCVALAVQNNTDLQIQRLGPVAATTQVRRARSIFDPRLFADILWDRNVTPAGSISAFTTGGTFLVSTPANPPTAGATAQPTPAPSPLPLSPVLFQQDFTFNTGVRKTLLSGGQLALTFSNNRLVTNPSVINQLVPRYTTALGLSLNQPLLRDFGYRYALLLVEVAQATEQAAYHQYAASIAFIVARVEQSYWALVLAIQNVEVQEHDLALSQELERQNEGKVRVGTLPQTAVLEAKSNVASRDALLIRARNAREVALDNLRAIINVRQPGADALVIIDPHERPTVTPYPIDLHRSLQTALDRRPELLAARLDVHGKGLQRKAVENQLLPRLNFVGSIGVNGLSGRDAGVGSVISQPNPSLTGGYGSALGLLPDGRYYNYSAGATIEVPIGNAQAKADYAKANIDLTQSRLSLQKLEETITLEIKTAVSNLETDLRSIDATRLARELAEENVRNQRARYDVGLATTKDLLDFEDRLTVARFAEVEALTRYNIDLAEMHRVEGTLLSARNILLERVSPESPPWWASF